MLAIEAEHVARLFRDKKGRTTGLRDLSLAVEQGQVLALLGPNGAGKTTAVRGLSTLAKFDTGRARVAGFDVGRAAGQVRRRIGLVGQYAAVDDLLSARKNLVLFGRLRGLRVAAARHRADVLLEQFALVDAADRPVAGFSGGMRRRLDLAASLITPPQVLFVDEPTTGLDPQSRRDVWDAIRALLADGTTVLLTTQYLEEADALANEIVILADGRVIAGGTSDELKSTVGPRIAHLRFETAQECAAAHGAISLPPELVTQDSDAPVLSIPAADGSRTLTTLVQELDAAGIHPAEITLRKPSLDEVFLTLTNESTVTSDHSTEEHA